MTAHTPGPWHVGGTFLPDSPDAHCSIWSAAPAGCASGDQVAQYVAPCDANLIAAAPDLLEALRTIAAAPTIGGISAGERKGLERAAVVARAAITKATTP